MKIKQMIAFILIGLMLLTGCGKSIVETNNNPSVYFYDMTKGKLVPEQLSVEFNQLASLSDQVKFILDTLQKGSLSTTLPATIKLPISSCNIKGNVVEVNFNSEYNTLTVQEKMIARAVLITSLTQLDEIDGVEFLIENEPMRSGTGELVGVNKSDAVITDTIINPEQATVNQVVTLYFTSSDGKELVKEHRKIALNNSVSQEKYLIEELIKGPQNEGLQATMPAETVVKEVTIGKDGMCQVDLSFDLKSKFFQTPESKYMMIYSIVNTLTESPKINKVAFLVDGKKDIEFSKEIDLRESFVRNEALIMPEVNDEE